MATVQEAVKAARTYLDMVYEGKAERVRLEEVETSDSADHQWRITLSFILPHDDGPSAMSEVMKQLSPAFGGPFFNRHLKVFLVDASGRAKAMKMREK